MGGKNVKGHLFCAKQVRIYQLEGHETNEANIHLTRVYLELPKYTSNSTGSAIEKHPVQHLAINVFSPPKSTFFSFFGEQRNPGICGHHFVKQMVKKSFWIIKKTLTIKNGEMVKLSQNQPIKKKLAAWKLPGIIGIIDELSPRIRVTLKAVALSKTEILLMEKNPAFTSWYGKYTIIFKGFIHVRWLFGISEASTVGSLNTGLKTKIGKH